MKNNSTARYMTYTIIGFVILAAGAVLVKISRAEEGIMLTLPYIMVGIGAGIFGQNLGTVIRIRTVKRFPEEAKKLEIEQKDERNIALSNRAKAKAYDLMIMVFGALMLAYALMNVNLAATLSLVAAYLFIVFSYIYYFNKFNKEM